MEARDVAPVKMHGADLFPPAMSRSNVDLPHPRVPQNDELALLYGQSMPLWHAVAKNFSYALSSRKAMRAAPRLLHHHSLIHCFIYCAERQSLYQLPLTEPAEDHDRRGSP